MPCRQVKKHGSPCLLRRISKRKSLIEAELRKRGIKILKSTRNPNTMSRRVKSMCPFGGLPVPDQLGSIGIEGGSEIPLSLIVSTEALISKLQNVLAMRIPLLIENIAEGEETPTAVVNSGYIVLPIEEYERLAVNYLSTLCAAVILLARASKKGDIVVLHPTIVK